MTVRQAHRRGPDLRGAAARVTLFGALAVVLLVLVGCGSGRGDTAQAVVTVVVERVVTATVEPTRTSAESGTVQFVTEGSGWRQEGESYVAAGGEDTFAWSTQKVSVPFTFSADVESDWSNYGEAMVVYGDGQEWSRGSLIFNVTGYWQAIRGNSIYDPDLIWLANSETPLLPRRSYRMTLQVTEDGARLLVDGALVASADPGSSRSDEGYLALVKYGGSAPVTFRRLVFQDAAQMAVVAAEAAAAATARQVAMAATARVTPPTRTPGPTWTIGPTRTPAPTSTQRPTRTPAPTRTPTTIPTLTDTPEPTNTPVPPFRPATGMLVDKAPGGYGELTIKNGTDADALVILTGMDEVAVKTGYIRAAESLKMTGIRDGTYLLFYSKGEAFSEETYRFTQGATYQKMDTEIPFETTATQYTVWELTLYGVAGGTVGTERVDPEDFP